MTAIEKSRNAENFAERLQIAMSDAGKSQAELARMLDTAWSTVDRWMKGSIPRRKMIEQIADSLCVASRWLETGEGSKKPDPQREATLRKSAERALKRGSLGEQKIAQVLDEIEGRMNACLSGSEAITALHIADCHTRLDEFGKWVNFLKTNPETRS
jgi:transcriptional regulator with XRE-family HTH domain